MLGHGFSFAFAFHADKDHFGSDDILKKLERLFEQKLGFFLILMFVGFELDIFHSDAEQNENLIDVVVIPLEPFVVCLEYVGDFLMRGLVLFAIVGDLWLRESDIFESGSMGDKGSDGWKVFC